jgi:hypothetical protein
MLNVNNVDEDIKYNLVEVSGSRGVNLTSQTTRLKHNQSGSFTISSNGIINLTTANPEIVSANEDYLYNGCINLITKNANSTTLEGENNINIVAGVGAENIQGGSISLRSGNGLNGGNSDGGEIEIIGGNGTGNGTGGQVRIVSGSSQNGNGSDIELVAGLGLYTSEGVSPGVIGGSINFQSGLAGSNCGGINFNTGTSTIQYLPTTIGPSGDAIFNLGQNNSSPNKIKSGRLRVNYGALKLYVFSDEDEIDLRIPSPERGDMCMIGNDIIFHNGTQWKTLTTN